ncbi:MAG: methylated-DNA--[protein]-cysteine S-methyltransferase [Rhodothermales bacterium]
MSSDFDRIESAIRFLEDNVLDQPRLDDIAAHIHLSPYHFERLFKRWAGVTPKQFLQHLTLSHAKERLRTSASVLEAAFAAGLSGPSRLHDLFVTVEAVTPGEFKQQGAGLTIRYGFHETRFGWCFVGVTDRGVCHLAFDPPGQGPVDELASRWPSAGLVEAPDETRRTVARIFGEESENGSSMRLLLSGTNFQLQVWQALLRVPAGHIVSYEDLAIALGRPAATRAVASAVARNPVGYLIPCHRVIRKSGHFGQYHWGSARKKAMVGFEVSAVLNAMP